MSNVSIPEHWQALLKQQASAGVLARGFPTRRWEDWKYTDVTPIVKHPFQLSQQQSVALDTLPVKKIENSISIVFVDGVLSEAHSELSRLPSGITLEQQKKRPLHASADQPFVQLNEALMCNGIAINVADNVEVKPVLHLLFINTDAQADTQCHWFHQVTLGRQAKLTVIEECYSQSSYCYFNNVVTHLAVGVGAHLYHHKLQREGDAAFHVANTQVWQQEDSHVESCSLSLGGILSRDDVYFHLQGQGAQCHLRGIFMAEKRQHQDHSIVVRHEASHCHSEQLYKGIAGEQGHGVFNGKIIVPEGVVQTVAHQANHNLLLSNQAEIDTKPELQIYADDVQCSHAATVGQLDEKALFYLRSRGIDEAQAKVMLMAAFIEDVILQLQDSSLQRYLKQALLQKES